MSLRCCAFLATGLVLALPTAGLAQSGAVMKVGAGTVLLAPRSGDKSPPTAAFRTEAMLKLAAPTNQWYSTLIFNPKPDPIYAQPLSFKTTPAGFEMALPDKLVVPTERQDTEIHYPHRDANHERHTPAGPCAMQPLPRDRQNKQESGEHIEDRGRDQIRHARQRHPQQHRGHRVIQRIDKPDA